MNTSSASPIQNHHSPSLFERLWSDYQWLVLGLLWVVSLVLGTAGFSRYAAAHQISSTFWDHLYLALQLIPMNSGAVESPLPWELEVARFLMPVLTAATAIKALTALFRNQMQLARLWRIHGHVVICGLSKKGIRLVRGFRARNEPVVVIERDEGNDYIEQCRSEGAVVLLGDATDAHLLLKAAVHRARLLISVTELDGVNAEIALNARQIAVRHRKDPLTCVIHIVDPQLCTLLREREISVEQDTPFRLEFFNVFEHAARLLLRQYPPFPATIKENSQPHLVVIGLGKMGESVVIQAARLWRELNENNHNPPLRISIIDLAANQKCESLAVRYPQLNKVCEIIPLQMNIRSAQFEKGDFLFHNDRKNSANAVYITVDDDSLGLHTGLVVNRLLRHKKIPIVVRMVEDTGLATLLHQGPSHNGFENLHEFSILDQTCTPELVLGGSHEVLARALHEEYVRAQRQAGETLDTNPLLVPWKALSPQMKENNYRQADHIGIKLKAVNRGITPLTDWAVKKDEFSSEETEYLARLEHERWCAELRRTGWTYAAGKKDTAARTHPALVTWEELPEADKQKNRVAVIQMPIFLAQAGLQIYHIE